MSIEAMKQALEALEGERIFTLRPDHEGKELTPKKVTDAITALRTAIEQAEKQEPVAWAGYNLDDMCEAFDRVIEEHHQRKNPFHDPVNKDAMIALRILRGFVPHMKRYTTPPAAPVQGECVVCGDKVRVIPRPWAGLTDEEVQAVAFDGVQNNWDWLRFARAIEAKLREKNT